MTTPSDNTNNGYDRAMKLRDYFQRQTARIKSTRSDLQELVSRGIGMDKMDMHRLSFIKYCIETWKSDEEHSFYTWIGEFEDPRMQIFLDDVADDTRAELFSLEMDWERLLEGYDIAAVSPFGDLF